MQVRSCKYGHHAPDFGGVFLFFICGNSVAIPNGCESFRYVLRGKVCNETVSGMVCTVENNMRIIQWATKVVETVD